MGSKLKVRKAAKKNAPKINLRALFINLQVTKLKVYQLKEAPALAAVELALENPVENDAPT